MIGRRFLGWLAIPMVITGLFLVACGEEETAVTASVPDAQVSAEDRSEWDGAKIYDEVCDRCHKMGVHGAPELGDRPAWQPRIAKGREVLLRHIHQGFNKMPARGDCEFCSDEQLAATLDYMVGRAR